MEKLPRIEHDKSDNYWRVLASYLVPFYSVIDNQTFHPDYIPATIAAKI